MAIYHFSMQIAKRNGGQRSLIAMAAYRSGQELYNELYDKTNYYGHREIDPESFILTPENTPVIYQNREYLWNEMEKAETQPNSQLCREINIALPVELSKEQNIELAKKYVEENFVSKGMIADVSVHYDDPNNPHFHVMLPMRKVDEDGNILNKRKRVPMLDENGEQMLNDKGQRMTVSLKTTDWDNKSNIQEWRKNWADTVNKELEINGFEQRISEKSHKDRGIELQPTKHEGYYTKKLEMQGIESELRQKNNEIRNDNNDLIRLKEKEKQIEILENNQNFKKDFTMNLSPTEKHEMSEIAKELKMYISPESVEQRLEQLQRWENSVVFNNKMDIQSKRIQLNKISDSKEKLEKANELIDKQSQRFVEKKYPNFDFSKLDRNDIRVIADETINQKKLFNQNELVEIVKDNRILKQEEITHTFKEKPFMTDRYLNKKIERLDNQISKEENPTQKDILKQQKQSFEKLKSNLESHIKNEVSKAFGNNIPINNVIHGEMLVASKDYYGNTNLADNLSKSKYEPEKLNSMLEQSKGNFNNISEFKKFGQPQGVYFIRDCTNNLDKLSPEAKQNLMKIANKNDYLPSKDKDFLKQNINTNEQPSKNISDGMAIMTLIISISKSLQQQQQQKKRDLESDETLSRQGKERKLQKERERGKRNRSL